MTDMIRISLIPLGRHLKVRPGTPLREVLFDYGVEFPCGGRGECSGCRVRVLEGSLPTTPAMEAMLQKEELDHGWRLSCQAVAESDLVLELGRWNIDILVDQTPFAFTPQKSLGVAVDVGTTTLAAQLLDLRTARVIDSRSALNAQAVQGADVMCRVSHAVRDGGLEELRQTIRVQIGKMVKSLVSRKASARGGTPDPLTEVVLVGNTVMHQLFGGIDVTPLSAVPFKPARTEALEFTAEELGWRLPDRPRVRFLDCIGGFVGSDVLAGILAAGLHRKANPCALVDLGTNGEIAVSAGGRLLCASTAAGPAFEGASISKGMRAATGAIYRVELSREGYDCQILGGGEPRGICGSGLVDAVACALDKGEILPSGRLASARSEILLSGDVGLRQDDVRQLQLAKGAIASGIRILCRMAGIHPEDLESIYLAGAFGNYIDVKCARKIGLLPFPPDRIHPCGNAALLGAKMILCDPGRSRDEVADILQRTCHVTLSEDPAFMDDYAEAMGFPAHPSEGAGK